ncbi:hypothetical protein ACFE04_021557 [Oxalis oulophora]
MSALRDVRNCGGTPNRYLVSDGHGSVILKSQRVLTVSDVTCLDFVRVFELSTLKNFEDLTLSDVNELLAFHERYAGIIDSLLIPHLEILVFVGEVFRIVNVINLRRQLHSVYRYIVAKCTRVFTNFPNTVFDCETDGLLCSVSYIIRDDSSLNVDSLRLRRDEKYGRLIVTRPHFSRLKNLISTFVNFAAKKIVCVALSIDEVPKRGSTGVAIWRGVGNHAEFTWFSFEQ